MRVNGNHNQGVERRNLMHGGEGLKLFGLVEWRIEGHENAASD